MPENNEELGVLHRVHESNQEFVAESLEVRALAVVASRAETLIGLHELFRGRGVLSSRRGMSPSVLRPPN